jgi:hypothetical protein
MMRDRSGQRVWGDEGVPPHPIEQLFLGDQSIPVRDEKSKNVAVIRRASMQATMVLVGTVMQRCLRYRRMAALVLAPSLSSRTARDR